jgi:predicted DNA-binding ribbon-helix-helix protein
LNVFKPLIVFNVLQSPRLLGDASASFARNMVDKLEPAWDASPRIWRSPRCWITALNPSVGYDRAVKIGKTALSENLTLRAAGVQLGLSRGGVRQVDTAIAEGESRSELGRERLTGLVKRSITLAGHRTSVALEPEFWQAIASQAQVRGLTISAFVADVDAKRVPQRPLASALRVAVLQSSR